MPQGRTGARPSPTPVLRSCTFLESPLSRTACGRDFSRGQPNVHVNNEIDRDLREASSLATRLRRQIAEEQHRNLIERSLLEEAKRGTSTGAIGTMGQARDKSRTSGQVLLSMTMSSDEANSLTEQRKMETLLANQRRRIRVLSSGCREICTSGTKKDQSELRPHSCPQPRDSSATRKAVHVDSNTMARGSAKLLARSSAKQLSAANVYDRIRAVAEETRNESAALRSIHAEQRAYLLEKNRAMVLRERSFGEYNGMCSPSVTTNRHHSLPLREGAKKGREAILKKNRELHDEVLQARRTTRTAQLSEALEEVRRLKAMLEEASSV